MKLDKFIFVCSLAIFFTMVIKNYPVEDHSIEFEEVIEVDIERTEQKEVVSGIKVEKFTREIAMNKQSNGEIVEKSKSQKNKTVGKNSESKDIEAPRPPTLIELKDAYELSENHKIELGEEFEFYISQNTLVKPSNDSSGISAGSIVNQRWGYIEFDKGQVDPFQSIGQFPVVVSKQTGTVGYITGELVVPMDQYRDGEFANVDVIRHDKDLNISFLVTNDFDELQGLIKKYKKYKEFNLRIKDSHNYPI